MVKASGRISVFVLLLMISLFVSVAFAAEKSDSCPTEFDPDNSMWAMTQIDIKTSEFYVEYVRTFSYFPDADKIGLFVHLGKLRNLSCFASLHSYGARNDADGKRVWGGIHSFGEITFFLLVDGKWESGDNIAGIPDCEAANQCNLVFTLYEYKKGVSIASASRVLTIGR